MSFRELQQWLTRNRGNAKRLGVDLANVVADCDWFVMLRDVRDSIVHRGGSVHIFPEQGRILFQVNEGFRKKVHINGIMYNENVVDFELYAAVLIGYLLHYLEDVANVLHTKLTVDKVGSDARSFHSGLEVVRNWFDRLCDTTES